MVHRSFLGKSLTDPTFEHTRKTCMEASKTILKEARQALDTGEGPMLWIDQAFMVAAGITLSLDIFHRQNTDPEYEEHRKHVETTIRMLNRFENSMIAIRGVRLLTSLLAEQARLSAQRDMENYRKRAREDDSSTTPGGSAPTPNFLQANDGSFTYAIKRQKFDVPKFLESFVGSDNSFSQSLRSSLRDGGAGANLGGGNDAVPASMEGNGDMVLGNGRLGNVLMQQPDTDKLPSISDMTAGTPNYTQNGMDHAGVPPIDYGYDQFEQFFPPQGGAFAAAGDLGGHPGSEGLDAVGLGNAAPMQVYSSGTAHLSSEFPGDKATPLLPVPNHTPAQQRFRKQFPPMFMSLKQPAIPGIWGSWDPIEGQPKEPESEWPQYNIANIEAAPHAQQQLGSAGNAHASVPSASIDEKQSTPRPTPANPSEAAFHPRASQSQTAPSLPTTSSTDENNSNKTHPPQPQTQTAQTTPPSPQIISTDLCFPAPPPLPTHLFTFGILPPAVNTPSSTTEQPRYTSPPPPPKHFNPSTDLEKDEAIKRVISATQNNNDNGPIWGVASKPPITFDGDEDYSGVLTGGGGGFDNDTEQRGLSQARDRSGTVTVEETEAGVQSAGAIERSARGSVNNDNDNQNREAAGKGKEREKEKEKGQEQEKEKPRGWFAYGSIWNV
ncbi:hypothetical protein LTR70_006168 [Exophiala xenobiotica]|uniref:Uncharacterized protein n=1 Tax=Lithohypha guttulata TaxID=1690604 RepID=A0ABR0K7M1_9EURO|nr:hypothetical protein LTR24_005846 [Lithohypha guttulata]KAK5316619.1 hypothetical protein LTR70_006168 [Exophiala xenobiotica]